jgi:hypothetical protein
MAGGSADKGVSTISDGNEAVWGVWSGGRDGFLVAAMLSDGDYLAVLLQNEWRDCRSNQIDSSDGHKEDMNRAVKEEREERRDGSGKSVLFLEANTLVQRETGSR